MANISATAGALTGTSGEVTNAKFLEWSNLYIRAQRGADGALAIESGTNQQKITYIAQQLGKHFRQVAIVQKAREASATAGDAVTAEEGGTDFG